MNVFTGIGRMGKDPESKPTQSGSAIVKFSIAINRRFKNSQTNEYETDWLNCVAFGKTGEFVAKYFRKGAMIGIVGSVQTRNWDDTEGKKHYATEIIVEQAHFCGSKQDGGGRAQPAAQGQVDASGAFFPEPDDTSLPFDI